MARETRQLALRETLVLFAAVTAATLLLRRLEAVSALIRDNVHVLVGGLFLYAAISRAERLPGGLPRYGLSLGGLLSPDPTQPAGENALTDLLRAGRRALPDFVRELGFALMLCAVVFPPFVLLFQLWHAPTHAFHFIPPSDLAAAVATQVLVVGLPEEALFRGYIQGRLHDAFPARKRFLGAELSWAALLLQALLFALIHFAVDLQPVRLAVFVPGLWFGWIARRRDGIGAAVFVHAFSNLLSDILVRGFL
jgi:uncharacterized protein